MEREQAARWDEPVVANDKGGVCGMPWCDGTELASTAPTPNFSNVNARAVLRLLGLDSQYLMGSCDAATMLRVIFLARNGDVSSARRDEEILEAGHAGVAVMQVNGMPTIERRGPKTIMCGNTDEQTQRRLAALHELAAWAQENGHEIAWG
jgi:hypothetical protein